MAINRTLLATVAFPLMSLGFALQPASAQPLRPAVVMQAPSNVVMVAMDVEDAKARLRAARQALADAKANGGDVDAAKAAVQEARSELDAAMAGSGNANQDDNQQAGKRKKQQGQDAQQGQDNQDQGANQKKRKKQQADVQDNGQQDGAKVIEVPAESKVNGNAEQPVKKKKKNAQVQDADTMQAVDPAQQAAEPTVKDKGSIEVIDTKQKKKKPLVQDNASGAPAEEVKRKQVIAADPSKSNDTIELPVKNGAAVLDSEKDADNSGNANTRAERRKLRQQAKQVKAPKSDAEAQAGFKNNNVEIKIAPALKQKGEVVRTRPVFDQPDGRKVGNGANTRIVFNLNNRIVVKSDDRNRIVGDKSEVRYERLDGGRTREIIIRGDGTRIVTVRNRFGEIIRRSRIDNRDREVVIFFSPELNRGGERLYLRDPGLRLPPMRLTIPVEDYIIDTSSNPRRNYREFLARPPVEQVERVYSLDEVKYSARIRDKVRRIDLDTITFDTGSAEISMGQASSLQQVAKAINDLLDEDPGETFLIEGHTDAVGSDESNLVLSDQRAESVASVLTDLFAIPPENLATQGYGERFLKVDTDEAERLNRRVTIRRVTALVRPVAEVE